MCTYRSSIFGLNPFSVHTLDLNLTEKGSLLLQKNSLARACLQSFPRLSFIVLCSRISLKRPRNVLDIENFKLRKCLSV